MRSCRFVLLISLALVGVLFVCGEKQGRTAAAFAHSRLQFEHAALQVLEQGSTQGVECPKGVRSVQLWTGPDGRENVVEFLCGAGGWGSSTRYWGVNYVVKDKNGKPLKEWYAISAYLEKMGGEISADYAENDGRKTVYSSCSPTDLLRNANVFTYAVLIALLVAITAVTLIAFAIIKKIKKRK